jgi:L,D-peptidoglycan transpeptidase YkuD (ErfK/YbiS/YcfS/YnhG family)
MIFAAFRGQDGLGRMAWPGREVRAALGKGGLTPAAIKHEGDGASPIGAWPVRRVLYRPDKGPPPRTALPVEAIEPNAGWCDAPLDKAYNRPVALPYPASAERLWRGDEVYDLIVILGHNDDPVVPGAGSAIFLHLARPDHSPTEGCVALARAYILALRSDGMP